MLITEQLQGPLCDWDVEVVASDLDQEALEVAQQGLYAEWSFRDAPTDLRRRYFTSSRRLAVDRTGAPHGSFRAAQSHQ